MHINLRQMLTTAVCMCSNALTVELPKASSINSSQIKWADAQRAVVPAGMNMLKDHQQTGLAADGYKAFTSPREGHSGGGSISGGPRGSDGSSEYSPTRSTALKEFSVMLARRTQMDVAVVICSA